MMRRIFLFFFIVHHIAYQKTDIDQNSKCIGQNNGKLVFFKAIPHP